MYSHGFQLRQLYNFLKLAFCKKKTIFGEGINENKKEQ